MFTLPGIPVHDPGITVHVHRNTRRGIKARCKKKFVVTTGGKHDLPIAPNLLARNFAPEAPNQVWSSDITYIATDEGWLYLTAVIDLFSRQVVGWSMREHVQASVVTDALRMAWFRRRPAPGLIFHSDRGSLMTFEQRWIAAQQQDRTSA